MPKENNLTTDLHCDVIIDTSSDFFAMERAYDTCSDSFDTLDPLEQMCFEEGSDGFELWNEKNKE